MNIGIVTDEISRSLDEALDVAGAWGLALFELREGSKARFPGFTKEEIARVDAAVDAGARITAVSPGIFKGHVRQADRRERELSDTLPRTIELAQRFGCRTVIVFGFDRADEEDEGDRSEVLRAFEQAAERAADAGLRLAVENEPNFWIDAPREAVALLDELDHPGMHLNWDPANQQWGGHPIREEDLAILGDRIVNLHVKDYSPADPAIPWVAVGQGITPWDELLAWLAASPPPQLTHLTMETHCEPLMENARASLDAVRRLLG